MSLIIKLCILGSQNRYTPTQNIQLAPVSSSQGQSSLYPRLAASDHHQPPHSPPQDSEVGASSADEMTVNALAEKKRRLISRVLAPGKRNKHDSRLEDYNYQDLDDLEIAGIDNNYEELTIDSDRERERDEKRRKKERKKRKKEKERRERREREEIRRQDQVLRLGTHHHGGAEKDELKENTSPQRNKGIIFFIFHVLKKLFYILFSS